MRQSLRGASRVAMVLAATILTVVLAGCKAPKTAEVSREKSMESGKAVGMKQAEMMKQGKMGMPKTGG